jgi:RimJ/RimL family protein N-acetyltransferase
VAQHAAAGVMPEGRLGWHLSTPRCVLRAAEVTDLPDVRSAVRSPAFPARLPLAQMTDVELFQWLHRMCERTSAGTAVHLSIDLRNSGASCAGQISFVPKPDPRAWNLAFWLHPQHWGHGVALEAVSRAIEGVFEAPMCAVLHAGVARWNHASMRTIARLGFSHTGDNPAGYFVAAAPEPVHEYELTLEQWHAARKETG